MLRISLSFLVVTYFVQLSNLVAQNNVSRDSERDNISFTNQRRIPCATADPTVDQIIESKVEVDEWLRQNSTRNREQVIIYVIWHAVHSSDNTGNISDSRIAGQIEAMNIAYSNNNTNNTNNSNH